MPRKSDPVRFPARRRTMSDRFAPKGSDSHIKLDPCDKPSTVQPRRNTKALGNETEPGIEGDSMIFAWNTAGRELVLSNSFAGDLTVTDSENDESAFGERNEEIISNEEYAAYFSFESEEDEIFTIDSDELPDDEDIEFEPTDDKEPILVISEATQMFLDLEQTEREAERRKHEEYEAYDHDSDADDYSTDDLDNFNPFEDDSFADDWREPDFFEEMSWRDEMLFDEEPVLPTAQRSFGGWQLQLAKREREDLVNNRGYGSKSSWKGKHALRPLTTEAHAKVAKRRALLIGDKRYYTSLSDIASRSQSEKGWWMWSKPGISWKSGLRSQQSRGVNPRGSGMKRDWLDNGPVTQNDREIGIENTVVDTSSAYVSLKPTVNQVELARMEAWHQEEQSYWDYVREVNLREQRDLAMRLSQPPSWRDEDVFGSDLDEAIYEAYA